MIVTFQTSPGVGRPLPGTVSVSVTGMPPANAWVEAPASIDEVMSVSLSVIDAMKAGPVIVTVAPLAVAPKRPVGSPLTAAARPWATSLAEMPSRSPGSLVMPWEISEKCRPWAMSSLTPLT